MNEESQPVIIVETPTSRVSWVKIVATIIALILVFYIIYTMVLPILGVNIRKNLQGGGNSMITYNSLVAISNHPVLNPTIDYISSTKASSTTASGISDNNKPVLNVGLDEDFYLYFKVTAPDGSYQVWEKNSHCGNSVFGLWGGKAEENFVWGTTYRGTHTITCKICNPDAHSDVWSSKTVTVNVG